MDEIIYRHKPAHTPLITSCVTNLINSELLKNEDMSYIKSMGTGGEGMTEEFEMAAKEFFKKHNIIKALNFKKRFKKLRVYRFCSFG